MLQSEMDGRRKLYRVNKNHPLTTDLTTMLRKVTGIDCLVERVVDRIGENLEQVWILGSLAQGINSDEIEVILIGKDLDERYVQDLLIKIEQRIEKSISYQISTNQETTRTANGLQVWVKTE